MKWRVYHHDSDVDAELAALEASVPGFARQFGLWLGKMAGTDWPPLYDSRPGGWELFHPWEGAPGQRVGAYLFVARCHRGEGRGRWLLSAGSGPLGRPAWLEAERRFAGLARTYP